MSRTTPFAQLLQRLAREGNEPRVFRAFLAEEYDGIGQFVMVSLARSSASSAFKVHVGAGDFGSGQHFPAGTPVIISSVRGSVEVLTLGGKAPRSILPNPELCQVIGIEADTYYIDFDWEEEPDHDETVVEYTELNQPAVVTSGTDFGGYWGIALNSYVSLLGWSWLPVTPGEDYTVSIRYRSISHLSGTDSAYKLRWVSGAYSGGSPGAWTEISVNEVIVPYSPSSIASHSVTVTAPAGATALQVYDHESSSYTTFRLDAITIIQVGGTTGEGIHPDLGGSSELAKRCDDTEHYHTDRAPTTADDTILGFRNNTLWINEVTGEMWLLLDNTEGAADWLKVGFGPTVPAIAVAEADGAPDVSGVQRIEFDGATVTDDGSGQVTVGITGGSGIPPSTVDNKGDLIAATANDAVDNLPVGANGSGLVADSSQSMGLRWRLHNDSASAAPTTGDDSGDGYSIGSRWIDTTNDKEYVCLDASVGAAVWVETTSSGHAEDHDHDGTPTQKLTQANTHQSPDTDSGSSALHHTLGSGSGQAAAGNHAHGGGGGGGEWDFEIVKSANQDVTNSATYTDSTDLVQALAANAVYLIDFYLIISASSTTGDVKWRFIFPTLTRAQKALGWISTFGGTGADSLSSQIAGSVNTTWPGAGSVSDPGGTIDDRHVVHGQFTIATDGMTAGDLKVQFAQNAATPSTSARMHTGSMFRGRRLDA